ncbi:hypothetical protein ErPhphiEa104_gp082 [Erwinia phage phiEa104]|uniref:Uncharacterized protein n=8 Tax=Caudoviricetes TaxID=2731619 RepID=A0A6B9RGK0_9CAUD|nr:hypothetical protein Ea21-4_gp80 [Erwinia phage phiEa21-4]YP_004327057.1 hypothetical protein ErPhphiEa104_gp082 [Erwinia phage phiEa104]AXN57403.1 hypothetical protein SUNLIREN_103 [Erwinia phage SunLIRen]AYD79560.1 hypothetical protein LINGLNFE_00052 [Enterobacter phage phi63_307]QGF21814.1 hypothetical protein [Salmonella phage ST-3]QHI00627.1 hypothetical protein [Salmonella phage vB_SenM_SB18]UFD98392.1 hypothetical protein SPARTY_69 [Hafnia phage vB_HalM_SPARTY]UXD79881.1 hypothetic
MKKENVIFHNNYAMCFYGKPTANEKKMGENLLKFFEGKKHPIYQATRKNGFMQVGSAYSNFKLASGKKSQEARDEIANTLFRERHGLTFIEIEIEVDGTIYPTFAISKDDMRILFE